MSSRTGIDVVKALAPEDLLVLATIVALPWFYGGVVLTAYRCAAMVLALAAGWVLARRGPSGLGLDRSALWLLPAFLLGAWAFVQVVPLPKAWVAALSPVAARHQAAAFGPGADSGTAWLRQIEDDARALVPESASAATDPAGAIQLGAEVKAPPRWFTFSMQTDLTLERAFWYAALLLAFLLVHARTADARRAAVYRATLMALFGVLAAVGILNRLTAVDRVLWLRAAPETTHPFGPYINPDHFAGVMELGMPWLLGYGLVTLARRRADERLRVGHVLALVGAGFCAAAALLAASKIAALAIVVSSFALIAIAAWQGHRRVRWRLLGATATAVLLLGAVALYGPLRGRVVDYFAYQDLGSGGRTIGWAVGVKLANDYALTGSGFGAFREVFPAYQPRGNNDVWLQMHNDYLELYIAGGLIAVALVVWLAVAMTVRAARSLRSEFAYGRGLASLGLAVGLSAVALHELVDFNLQIPANALLFVAMAALCVSSGVRSSEGP